MNLAPQAGLEPASAKASARQASNPSVNRSDLEGVPDETAREEGEEDPVNYCGLKGVASITINHRKREQIAV